MILILTFIVNFSDHSESFAIDMEKSKILELITDLLLQVSIWDIQSTEMEEGKNRFIYMCVCIVNNFARNPLNSLTHKPEELKNCLLIFMRINSNDKLGVISVLTLSYLLDDSDKHLLDDGAVVVDHLIHYMKSSIAVGQRSDGFTLRELTHGLRCASANDRMKERICATDGIPVLIDILNNQQTVTAIEPALGTVEQLCFNDVIKKKLVDEFRIESIVKLFANDKSEEIRKRAEGVLSNLGCHGDAGDMVRVGSGGGEEDSVGPLSGPVVKGGSDGGEGGFVGPVTRGGGGASGDSVGRLPRSMARSTDKLRYDVFLSYCWANKDRIVEIVEHFRRSQICVWIDDEQMRGGSCFEAMARGIETSRLVLIAMSRPYYRSANCRREAEYAARINKPIIPLRVEERYRPASWLGLIAGAELYFEFSGLRDIGHEALRLVQSVRESLEEGRKGVVAGDAGEGRVGADVTGEGRVVGAGQCRQILGQWDNGTVLDWLEQHGLAHLRHCFGRIDGSLVVVMLDIRASSADYFNNALKNEFGMAFVDVLTFHKALNELVALR